MVDREKSEQARFKGLSERLKEDRISDLPDPLICQILSHIPTKDVVRTSLLSTRWRSLWLWVPSLEFDSRELPDLSTFVSFGDRFFDSSRASCIDKLKLTIAGNDVAPNLTSWIDAAVKRKIQDLYVMCLANTYEILYEIPSSLYNCETLVSLKLRQVVLPSAEFVSLPCLKTMHLTFIKYPIEATFERLISSCPDLEELEFARDVRSVGKVFRVLSKSLKSLIVRLLWYNDSEVVIDAPRLCFFSIKTKILRSFVIVNIDSNAKLYLDLDFEFGRIYKPICSSERDSLRSFLPVISNLRDITVARDTFEIFYQYSEFEPLPQFGNMSCLHVTLCVYHLIWLPTFLESFPNLKSLTVVCIGDYEEINEISFSSVPECLLSSLEFVDIKRSISGCAAEMELVKYILKNSVLLKKLTLCLCLDSSSTKDDIFKKLLEIPRVSTKCKVLIL